MENKDTANKSIKVVIIDDSKLTRVGLITTLKQCVEIEITGEAENGLQAIKLIEKLHPDVALMDIGMPIMDGIQAVEELKTKNIPCKIIMLTSHESESDVMDSLTAGANSYCMKDIEPSTLISVIKSTNDGASWLDPRIAKIVLKKLDRDPKSTKDKNQFQITEREIEILKLIAKGYSNSKIADTLCISLNTVKTHLKNIFQKLEVYDRAEAVVKAYRNEIIKDN